MKKLILIVILIVSVSFVLFSYTENPRCRATAKSTGNQCKNHQWSQCSGPYCYVHCK